MHAVSLGVAQHIAGNILHEIVYVLLASRGPVKSKVEGLWPLTLEAYRLDTATTRLGGLTLSMLTNPSRPHQVFPLLKAKGKETEWFCRALTFVLPQFVWPGRPVPEAHLQGLGLLLEFYVTVARGVPSTTRH